LRQVDEVSVLRKTDEASLVPESFHLGRLLIQDERRKRQVQKDHTFDSSKEWKIGTLLSARAFFFHSGK
jgi:hypothetical protein